MSDSTQRKETGRLMAILAILSVINIALWIVSIAIGGAPSGDWLAALTALASNSGQYSFGMFNAFLVAFSQVGLLLLLGLFVSERRSTILYLGTALSIPYGILVSIAYGTQFAFLPRVLQELGPNSSLVQSMYFHNPNSIVYFLDILGYTFWGVAALCIGSHYLGHSDKSYRFVGWTLAAAGLCNILGFMGYAIGNKSLELAVTIGGGLAFVWSILMTYLGFTIHRGYHDRGEGSRAL